MSTNRSTTDSEEVEQVFNRFDANGDGKISSTELAGVLDALGSGSSQTDILGVMKELDIDRDGFISPQEFYAFYRGSGADSEQIKAAFDLYDQDKDGLISASELHSILSRLGENFSIGDCTNMISKFDSDGDGCINFEEFNKMMAKPNNNSSPS